MDHTTADEEPSMRRKLMSLTPSSCCGSGSSGAESSAESSASTSPRGQPRSVGKLIRKLGRRKKKSAPTSAAQVAVLESPQLPSQQTTEPQSSSPRLPATLDQGSTTQVEGAGPTASTGNLDSCSSIVYFSNNFPTCFKKALDPFIISEDALLDLTRRSVDKVRNSLYEKLKDKDLQKGDEETLRTKLRLWEVQLASQSEDDVGHVVLLTARGRTNDLSAQDPASCTVIQKSLGLFGKDAVFLPDGQLVFALDPNPGSATQL